MTERELDDLHHATRAFASPLRVALLRHYARHPGSQAAAVTALGESSANVSRNTQVLVAAGVVKVDGSSYRTDLRRVRALLRYVEDVVLGD